MVIFAGWFVAGYCKTNQPLKYSTIQEAAEYRVIQRLRLPSDANIILSPDGSNVAYCARSGEKHSIWINDKKVTHDLDYVTYASEHFEKTGEFIFAGHDKEKKEIIHATLNIGKNYGAKP